MDTLISHGDRCLAARLLTEAREYLGTRFAFGDRKVFLCALFGTVAEQDMADVERLRRAGLITCARADLISAMDYDLVQASQWDCGGAVFHFIIVE